MKVKRQRELLCAVMGKVAVALVFNGLCYATRKTTIPNVQVIVEESSLRKDDFDIMVRKIQMHGRLLSMLPCIL